jgi:hypothetical protein
VFKVRRPTLHSVPHPVLIRVAQQRLAVRHGERF